MLSAGISHQGPATFRSSAVEKKYQKVSTEVNSPFTASIDRGNTTAERRLQRFQENMDFPVFHDSASMRSFSRDQRQQGRRIAFVPTMVRISNLSAKTCQMSDAFRRTLVI